MKTRHWVYFGLALLAWLLLGVPSPAALLSGQEISAPPTLKGTEESQFTSKLSPELLAQYQCSQKAPAADGQTCTPPSGKLEVQVRLTAASSKVARKLVAAGLKIKSGEGTPLVSGEIAIEKLEALAEVGEVSSIDKTPARVILPLRMS